MEQENTYLFKSEFVHDLKLQKEFLRASLHLNSYVKYLHLFLIGILLWFFYEMFFVLDAPREFSGGIVSITVLYLIIEGIRILSHIGGGIGYKRTLLTNAGKPITCRVQFGETNILTTNVDTDSKNTLGYDQIRAVYETKNLYLCAMKYRMFLIVDKRSLTGDREEFANYLLDRCPKIRRKKIRSIKTSQIISTVRWVTILVMLFIALLFHPATQLKERFLGQIHNGMSVPEILTELEGFGIACDNPEELEAIYGGTFYFSGSRLESILHYIGLGSYNYESNIWEPRENGVYYLYLWPDDPETMYTQLLEGISCLGGEELTITNIQEHIVSNEDMAAVFFDLNGKTHSIYIQDYAGTYNPGILNEIGMLVREATGKTLYFADSENYGVFLFYGDAAWAEAFSARTGLELVPDIYELY